MVGQGNNRFALFTEDDDNASPASTPTGDLSPFLNQVTDDSSPWQEVKKRGAPAVQHIQQPAGKTSVIRDQTRAALNRTFGKENRVRAASASTVGSNDKIYNPYELWCGVCSQKFSSKTALLSHIRQAPEHENYCNLCKRVFKDRNGLKNHVENSVGHEIFCNLCISAFKDEWGLRNHFENNYHVGHEFACLTCLLGFRTQFELERHLQTAEKHTWCGSCYRRFRTQNERDEHWQKTTKHKHCLQPGCEFDGPDEAALTEHLERDHFQCGGCKIVLPSQNKLNQHYDSCTFALVCPQCGEHCAGKAQLARHLEHCYLCEKCGFHTHNARTCDIHMTTHASTDIPCWRCDAPMPTYSRLLYHLESGNCKKLSDPTPLMLCLGKWWYSPLYMDLDIHAQIRTNRIDLHEVLEWMDGGLLEPFICRSEGCSNTFGHLSLLVLHCEKQSCGWDVARLNLLGLQQQLQQFWSRNDGALG